LEYSTALTEDISLFLTAIGIHSMQRYRARFYASVRSRVHFSIDGTFAIHVCHFFDGKFDDTEPQISSKFGTPCCLHFLLEKGAIKGKVWRMVPYPTEKIYQGKQIITEIHT
jgi:hypothetical protein